MINVIMRFDNRKKDYETSIFRDLGIDMKSFQFDQSQFELGIQDILLSCKKSKNSYTHKDMCHAYTSNGKSCTRSINKNNTYEKPYCGIHSKNQPYGTIEKGFTRK